jgi:3-oxoacid CoA-transferase subunit A
MTVFKDASEALFDLKDGMTLMSGGFGLCGIAENCITEILAKGTKNLTVISNNIGNQGKGLAVLLKTGQISEAICSYIGGNPDLEKLMMENKIKVQLIPQGTLSERIRAAGMGIRAFYTPTGYGTVVAEGKEIKIFDKPCLLETALHADYAIIKAQKADRFSNLWFKESARNFSPLMAMAAKISVVEVEEWGDIKPEDVHLPGIFVKRLFKGENYQNHIEHLKLSQDLV